MRARKVFITGGASGIGRAVSLAYARSGWDVACHYRSNEAGAVALCAEIEALGRSCSLVVADLGNQEAVERLTRSLAGMELDALVNNAGAYSAQTHFTQLDYTLLVQGLSVNFIAPLLLSSAVFPGMKARGFGRIVNMSSIAAKYGGSAYSIDYGCAKRALEGVTRTLAREGAAGNVLVNTVRPGVIDTDFHRKFPKDMTKRTELIPMGRLGTADEVAEVVVFLGSERNTFVTNETLAVAGGE